ncbi:MAG: 5'-nucleotidase [Gammaproteobacteria bacterium]|jgi:5'-nucleotidase
MAEAPKLIVAISSRALFDLDDSHKIFTEQGIEAYCQFQIENENVPLEPGVAFPLVKKLLTLNNALHDKGSVEVILLSRNSADTGLRIFNSIEHHSLPITRAAFTGGHNPFGYVAALGAHLFLSADSDDVRNALEAGIAAATLLPSAKSDVQKPDQEQLRIAFDGDAVLFSDEAEQVYRSSGLAAFEETEKASAHQPLSGGPFKAFLSILHQFQVILPAESSLIRTALITARGAPAHERVIRTLRTWGVRIDEALFLAGMEKGRFLNAFGADIFFDDQKVHCDSASQHVPTGHVPHGIANQ